MLGRHEAGRRLLPDPEARARRQIAAEIVEDLEAALAQFAEIAKSLGGAPDMEEGEASR